jgi:superfamily II RNA helicase
MILNLLRVEALRVEEMIKRSFSENASQRLLPVQQKKVIEVCTLVLLMEYETQDFIPGRKEAIDFAEAGL